LKSIKETEDGIKQRAIGHAKENDEFQKEKDSAIRAIRDVTSEFQSELNEFKTLKTKLSTQVVSQVCLDIKKELDVYIMNIKQKIDSLNIAAKDIEIISLNSKRVMESIDKLRQVSESIKKEDFELIKYSRELESNDREKLHLMQKIDVLERLIAKQRRSPDRR